MSSEETPKIRENTLVTPTQTRTKSAQRSKMHFPLKNSTSVSFEALPGRIKAAIMGIAEELEELRKQGVTTTYATDLKDVEGLSTPEISENAIKAEYQRTRPSLYGKEAKEYLSQSPTKSSSTNPFDDDYDPGNDHEEEFINRQDPESKTSEDYNPSKQQAKDITNLIQITNDFSRVGDQVLNVHDDIENNSRLDCPFGSLPQFCPVDSIESATSSVRGAINERVLPALNETRVSINTALDEHVIASVDRIRQQSMETVDGFHQRSLDRIDRARQQAVRTYGSATTETNRFLEQVQNTSQNGLESARQQSRQFLESSKEVTSGLLTKVTELVSVFVVPLTVTYAPYYTGTAPKWKDLSSSHWCVFEGTLRAFGRVVFCDNPVTGLFIFFGILSASPLAGICSILSVVTVNVTAMYLEMSHDVIRSGKFARHAVLIGTSLVDSFGFSFSKAGNLQSGVPILVFWSIALAPSTLVLELLWNKKVGNNTPSLLLPFHFVFLGALLCASVWNLAKETHLLFQSHFMEDQSVDFRLHEAVLNGFSRIFFVHGSGWTTGLLMLIGVTVCSRIIAASLLTGSLLATLLGYLVFGENHSYLDSGYAGANPALFVAGMVYHLVSSFQLSGLAVFGVMATLLVQGAVDVLLGIL